MKREVLQAVMDAAQALQRAQEMLEKDEKGDEKPVVYHDGPTDLFFCGSCRGAVLYADRYCRMCGRRIRWDG